MNWWDKEEYNKVGRVYGRLTVKKQVSIKGGRRYKCRCSCGKTTEVSAHNLITGGVISCGCALHGCNRRKPYEWLHNRLISVAKLRGLSCTITYAEFVKFCAIKTCHYCDAKIPWSEYNRGVGYSGAYSLDRKDSETGYTFENCVVCCTRCNRSKSNSFSYEEWVKIGRLIKSFTKQVPS